MLPFAPTVAAQIRYLLQSSKDSDPDSIVRELCQFVEYGNDGAVLLLQTCLDLMNLHSGEMQNMHLKPEILSAIFRYLLGRPNFSTVLCHSLRNEWMNDGFLLNLSKALNLSTSEKIGIGLALTDSENFDFKLKGQNYCIAQIEEICANPIPILSHQQIQEIFMFLHRSEGLSKHVDSFMKMLSLLQLEETSQFVLGPILEDDLNVDISLRHFDVFYGYSDNDFDAVLAEIEKEMSMADIIRELGYGCTATISHCKEMLTLFMPLDELTICKILCTIACTHIGHEDCQNMHSTFCSAVGINSTTDSSVLSSWNFDVLVDSFKQLAPETNWVHVMENMDHEGFSIPDEHSFSTFMSIYARACQDPFPLHAVCGSVWKNAEGQLSFLKYAVSAPSEVFTFAHSGNKLPHVESIHLPSGHGNQAWYCLDLLDVLSQLSERGHASAVQTLLDGPLKQLPELLLLGVAHTKSAYNLLQYEISSEVFPLVVRNSSKSFVIHHLWHVNPKIVLRGFMDIYSKDPEGILRILDLCQELKIISSVLDATPFSFSIKLAAVASRKEYINLEKWLNDNLNTYKDSFFEGCMDFLKGLISDGMSDHSLQRPSTMMNVYQEALPIFLKGLQAHSGLVSQHLSEEFRKLHLKLSHANPRMQNVVASETVASDGSSEDVETEANSYFHQMFSEQLSVDTMVQTLARFKESSDRREQLIFECMIGNLFEEYKFFPKYPDRQLKIAAVLFGSLIKHQLVTHLTLGIALRCVLDALRKSIDSKMFLFGAKALEQFMDRLIEWPQYCNHILQISHLRSTHAELVSFIERALAQISSSQSESNGRNSIPSDQNQVSSMQAPAENIEASEPTWPLIGSGAVQTGQQISSSFQLQQRHQGSVEERLKTSATSVTSLKPQPAGQSSMVSASNDSVISQKHTVSGTASALSSPGILRPSRALVTAGIHRPPSYSTAFGAPMNIETLVAAAERRDTPIETPASEIQDKILFMINNISAANMDAKAKEFTEVLNEQYYPWFAQYMVMKRASIEPNFHDLYLKFLDKVNSKSLNKEILKATYENCKVLLRSDLIKSSSEERSLLKNLGSWLGKFTIGRNQALRAREIDPKVLIIEAYERGLMIAVIPFTSKILEPCQSSLAYKPPNPWTMGILSLLTEIYNLPNLKMNLKFDIEVLFKNLAVDLKDVKPTVLLKDRVRELEGNPDFSTKDMSATQAPIVAEVNTGMIPSLSPVDMQADVSNASHLGVHPNVLSQFTALHLASSALGEEEKMGALGIPDRVPSGQGLSQVTPSQTPFSISQYQSYKCLILQSPSTIPNIGTHVVVNPKLNALGLHLQFQRVLPLAMEKAIREIISPVVQRSVTIASQTTRELVLKDYAMESDESRIYNAAHLMVASLAGSLAHVTCKEPLRIAMSGNLRTLVQSLNVGSELLEQAVQLVTNDNLDLGCAVIEQAATEKALQNIDGEIATSLAFRRKQRESTGAAYFDAGTYAQSPFARVPEALRPKPGRLSIAQQRVYEDFVRFPWQNQTGQSSNAAPAGQSVTTSGSVSSAVPHVYGSSSGQLNSSVYLTPQVAPGFSSAAQPLDFISEEMDPGSAQLHSVSSSLGMAADVGQQTAGISTIAASFPTPPEVHVVESLPVVKDLGAVVPPSPSPATERLTTVISEPLSTGDALDKYQLLAQKVYAKLIC
ncbi:hypothetical protein Taro_042254 [Colocasia esculenta]|uniref:CCR4-NOT transcription complex subunit 1 n=1 Tax=Colocasia esculenta TaxID=4460 RepID=A0A843WY37_COLES|nr:hypothetical protein [Colocasia esculenta]